MWILVALCLPLKQELGVQQTVKTPQGLEIPRLIQSQPLNQDAIDEIKKIRDRVGIKLFDDSKKTKEFELELQKLSQAGPRISKARLPNVVPPRAKRLDEKPRWPGVNKPQLNLSSTNGTRVKAPVVQPASKILDLTLPSRKTAAASSTTYMNTLFQTVANLDQAALELEKQGEFEKSAGLRKLSRKIRKQIQGLVTPRDN